MDHYRHVNPYIAGSPVTGTEMFYGRQDVFSFLQRNLIGLHRDTPVVLYGQRRTGKTSVLYQLHRHLDARYRCIFIDLHGLNLNGMGNLLLGIANSISRALRRDHQISVEVPDRAVFLADPRSAFEVEFLDKVWPALVQDHLVLMVDEVIRLDEEVRAGRLERGIFDYLRHLMQHNARLIFIFSLGSGLEEMARDYAFLFSVSLYHRISFLEPAAARELITQPVRDHYQMSPEAVEKILGITSGHPYYTQLVCHCLFDLWVRSPKTLIGATDIDVILTEAIELGSANLTYVWEDSTPEEQMLLAGMAAAMRSGTAPVTVEQVRNTWRNVSVWLPEREAVRALRSLTSREVIAGRQSYSFTVDLQRLWLERHRPLDWVKEELAATAEQWNRAAEPWPADVIPVQADRPGLAVRAEPAHSELREPGGKPRTTGRRRHLLIAAAVAVLAIYLAATSAAGVFPFPNRAQAPNKLHDIIQLLPGDLSLHEHGCYPGSAPNLWSAPGLVQVVHCTDQSLKGGNVYAYQLDSITDFQDAWRNFNQWWRFLPAHASATCPPRGTAQGMQNLSTSALPEADRQVLECGLLMLDSKNIAPAYVWSFPANDVLIIAIGALDSSFAALDYWVHYSLTECCVPSTASSGGKLWRTAISDVHFSSKMLRRCRKARPSTRRPTCSRRPRSGPLELAGVQVDQSAPQCTLPVPGDPAETGSGKAGDHRQHHPCSTALYASL